MQPSNRDVLRFEPPRGLKLVAVAVVGILAAVVVIGVLGRVRADQGLKRAVAEQSIPTVELVDAKAERGAQNLVLPGAVEPFENATIHARVSGYLKRWYPDIGAHVRTGQLLAEIDTPDLDQQLAEARAGLATAKANETLSKSTEARWKALLAADAVSQQEYDEKAGDLAAKITLVASAQANLARLEATAAFKRVVAPFDGVVTQRATDIGSLIAAGGGGDPLYTVADARRLRVYVRAPQTYTPQIHPGMTVALHAPERPGESFKATVATDSHAIDARSGTLLVELQLDNADGRLKPGQYVQADFSLPTPAAVVTVPATALMYRATGPQIALIGPDGRVKIRGVTIGKDLGSKVQIVSGAAEREKIVDNPPDGLADGDQVRVISARKDAARG